MKNITSGNSEIESKEIKEASRIPGKVLKISKKKKKRKVSRKLQWSTILTDHLVDIILVNDKFKEKLSLTNV